MNRSPTFFYMYLITPHYIHVHSRRSSTSSQGDPSYSAIICFPSPSPPPPPAPESPPFPTPSDGPIAPLSHSQICAFTATLQHPPLLARSGCHHSFPMQVGRTASKSCCGYAVGCYEPAGPLLEEHFCRSPLPALATAETWHTPHPSINVDMNAAMVDQKPYSTIGRRGVCIPSSEPALHASVAEGEEDLTATAARLLLRFKSFAPPPPTPPQNQLPRHRHSAAAAAAAATAGSVESAAASASTRPPRDLAWLAGCASALPPSQGHALGAPPAPLPARIGFASPGFDLEHGP